MSSLHVEGPKKAPESPSSAAAGAAADGGDGGGGDNAGDADKDLLPALFWDGTEDWINEDNCADFAALQSLKYDDTTPEERAEAYKTKGNEALKYKQNKIYVRKAVQQYTLGLMERVENPELNSTLHSNRAHAALLLGNMRKALEDAKEAVRLNPNNVKGWFRAAKSAFGLEKLEECAECCQEGLKLEKSNRDMLALSKASKKKIETRTEQTNRDDASRITVASFLTETSKRRLEFGPPIMGTGERMPELSEDDGETVMTYWVLFVYPESMQTDVIEKFDERSTFAEHLDNMFGEGAPPLEWDGAGHYTRNTLELYYQTNAVRAHPVDLVEERLLDKAGISRRSGCTAPQGDRQSDKGSKVDPRDQRMVRIDEGKTLAEVLAVDDHVIPGHPVVYVVSKNSDFRAKFLAGEWEI